MSEWQPIETAPKDGTRILLCDDRCKPFPTLLGKWRHGAWWSDLTNSGAAIVWGDATHWMPLPAPPNNQVQPASGQDLHRAGNHDAGSAGTQS